MSAEAYQLSPQGPLISPMPCSYSFQHTHPQFGLSEPTRHCLGSSSHLVSAGLLPGDSLWGLLVRKAMLSARLWAFQRRGQRRSDTSKERKQVAAPEHSKPAVQLAVRNTGPAVSPPPTTFWPGMTRALTEKVPSSWETAQGSGNS